MKRLYGRRSHDHDLENQLPSSNRFVMWYMILHMIYRIRYYLIGLFILGYLHTWYEHYQMLTYQIENTLLQGPPNERCGGDIHLISTWSWLLLTMDHRDSECNKYFKIISQTKYPNPFVILIEYLSFSIIGTPLHVIGDIIQQIVYLIIQPFHNPLIQISTYVIMITVFVIAMVWFAIQLFVKVSTPKQKMYKLV
jgi:hypothetical protein